MDKTPRETLIDKIDELDLNFMEGENDLEFDIDNYSFTVTYSLEADEIFIEDEESIEGNKKLKILSINAYDNIENEDINIEVDKELQKLFSNYYNSLIDDDFIPLSVNFGEMSDFFDN